MDKLGELREKKAVMTAEYKTKVHKLNLAADERMSKVKEEYRIAHDAAIQNGREALEELRKDYESRLKPLLKEEEEAIEALGHDVTDFAKTRFEKGRSR